MSKCKYCGNYIEGSIFTKCREVGNSCNIENINNYGYYGGKENEKR